MRYQIPQFINVEDKIFGPFSFKQFLYLLGGGGISYVLWNVLPKLIALIPIAAIMAFSIALAFFKVNERPFIFTVQAFFNYITHPKMFFWQRKSAEDFQKEYAAQLQKRVAAQSPKGPSAQEKIETLSQKLDILDRQ